MAMPSVSILPKLYGELASWFHLLSNPADYAEEAEFARNLLVQSGSIPPRTLLELGSGGGNNASHLKMHFQMTMVDLSAGMLELSRALNPECEHLVGDMRSVRLGRVFDGVFVHDAIMYMTTEQELRQVLETAFIHCKSGGTALFMPDVVREKFVSLTTHGGHDAEDRGIRYIEWTFDPDPSDTTYTVDFAYLLREGNGPVRVEHDQHVFGLFMKEVWLQLLRDAGFNPAVVADPWDRLVFVCSRE